MKVTFPTRQDIQILVSYLPRLYAPGFEPIKAWKGGTKTQNGSITTLWPDYEDVVREFFESAGQACWSDYDYVPYEARKMLEDDTLIRKASLEQIKTMLTYCVRGERFSDGHWEVMIESGKIRALLKRLQAILSEIS